jgi:hypothetical protein
MRLSAIRVANELARVINQAHGEGYAKVKILPSRGKSVMVGSTAVAVVSLNYRKKVVCDVGYGCPIVRRECAIYVALVKKKFRL